MTTHIMLDLETWGTRPGCDIRSIGACVFDPVAGITAASGVNADIGVFYVATDNPLVGTYSRDHYTPQQLNEIGGLMRRYTLHRDASTVKWWNEQRAEAQAAFADPIDLKLACASFDKWLHDVCPLAPPIGLPPDIRLWAHDPHFDVSILEAVYHAVRLPTPWHYRAPRSLRTIADAAGMTRDDFAAFNHGTAHNALDDAIAQAGIVCEAYKRLGLTAPEPRTVEKTIAGQEPSIITYDEWPKE